MKEGDALSALFMKMLGELETLHRSRRKTGGEPDGDGARQVPGAAGGADAGCGNRPGQGRAGGGPLLATRADVREELTGWRRT